MVRGVNESDVKEASSLKVLGKVIGKRDASMVHQLLVQCVSLQQGMQLAEGEGFGVESIGFEVLMNFSKARHTGLELSRGPGKRKAAVGFG